MKTFTVGVTGHRHLPDMQACEAAIRRAVADICARVAGVTGVAERVLLSPLAEGADRLAAHAWLAYPGHILEAPLPMAVEAYLQDFGTPSSRQEFMALLAKSRKQTIIPAAGPRTARYRAAGVFVADHCDLLLAIWDGRPPTNSAGTAAIVEYARNLRKPLYWIDANNPETVTGELLDEIFG